MYLIRGENRRVYIFRLSRRECLRNGDVRAPLMAVAFYLYQQAGEVYRCGIHRFPVIWRR